MIIFFLKQTLTIDHTSQVFQLIEKEFFYRLLMYLCPSLADRDISHCTKLCKEILEQAEAVESWRIKDKLHVSIPFFYAPVYDYTYN